MKTKTFQNWKKVWEDRIHKYDLQKIGLETLINLDGFDGGAGKMNMESWGLLIKLIKHELGIEKKDKILEIGCGAGALLFPLFDEGFNLAGIDYSASLIEVVRKVLPGVRVEVAEANRIPFPDKSFNKIYSHSVFQYLPGYDYAEEVLREILRLLMPKGRVLILDVPDKDKEKESEAFRAALGGGEKRDTFEFHHLYYPRKIFEGFCKSNKLRWRIFDNRLPNYANAEFRFHVLFWRE